MHEKLLVFHPAFDEVEFFEKAARDLDVTVDFCEKRLSLDSVGRAAGYDAVVSQPTPTDEALIAQLVNGGTRLLQTMSVGVDHIDFEAAGRLGLEISVASYSPHSVGEFTVMLMLMTLRRARAMLERFAVQDFRTGNYRGLELQGKTVGIYGAGSIGMVVARLCAAFGARVLAYSPSRVGMAERACVADKTERTAPGAETIEFVELDRLLAQSDLLSIHARTTPETFHFFDAQTFGRMKHGAILINTARGDIVDTDALIDALESGQIAAAGLDVIDRDRQLYFRDHHSNALSYRNLAILKAMPQVTLFPHAAYYTDEASYDYTYGSIARAVRALRGGREV